MCSLAFSLCSSGAALTSPGALDAQQGDLPARSSGGPHARQDCRCERVALRVVVVVVELLLEGVGVRMLLEPRALALLDQRLGSRLGRRGRRLDSLPLGILGLELRVDVLAFSRPQGLGQQHHNSSLSIKFCFRPGVSCNRKKSPKSVRADGRPPALPTDAALQRDGDSSI